MNHDSKNKPNEALKPLSEKELDEIFAPKAGDEHETTSVGRSYGWSDQKKRREPRG